MSLFLAVWPAGSMMALGDSEISVITDFSESAQAQSWSVSIPDMLAAGPYEEGVVIVGIDMSKAEIPTDPGSALEEEKLGEQAESLITVDADAVDEAGAAADEAVSEEAETAEKALQPFSSELRYLKESLSWEREEEICITSIRRDDMTTEQILYMLAGDDSVVFAEPNYTFNVVPLEDMDKTDLSDDLQDHHLTVGIGDSEEEENWLMEDEEPQTDITDLFADGDGMETGTEAVSEDPGINAEEEVDHNTDWDPGIDADEYPDNDRDEKAVIEEQPEGSSSGPGEEVVNDGTGLNSSESDDLFEFPVIEDASYAGLYEAADTQDVVGETYAVSDDGLTYGEGAETFGEAISEGAEEYLDSFDGFDDPEPGDETPNGNTDPAFAVTEQIEIVEENGNGLIEEIEEKVEEGVEEEIVEDSIFTADGGLDSTSREARDVSALQWGMSENATLRAADTDDPVSIRVPGWPAGSNMDHPIVVAVLDLPVDFGNPDLYGSAYTFSAELIEELGCDTHGYNALWDAEDGKLEYYPADERGDHGTHVAGIIGAAWDGKGASGVASNVQIVSVQNGETMGRTSLINTLRGMNFIKEAKKSGVDIRIVNNSWVLYQTSRALSAAVNELGSLGIISVFCAGNEAWDLNAYTSVVASLADNPYAVIVASTDPSGNLADNSSYGKGIVTLGAPGVNILSTIQTQSAEYNPAIASQNKYYEDFESGVSSLRIFQVDSETGQEIPGTQGVVVSGENVPGFEGECVYRVNIDRSGLDGSDKETAILQIDLGEVSDSISAADWFGFAYGAQQAITIDRIVDTASGAEPVRPFMESGKAGCMKSFVYDLPAGINSKDLSFRLEIEPGRNDEVFFDAVGIGNEKQPYGFMSGTSMAAPAVSGAAAVLASRYFDELKALDAIDPAYSAEMLAGLVRSSVRPLPSLANVTSTGGIIDLSVDPSAQETVGLLSSDLADVETNDLETPQNGIPLVVIRVDEKELHQTEKGKWYGTIADMNNSPDHSVRCEGSVEILLPEEGYTSAYGGTVPVGGMELDYIRGRGNSTWRTKDKKPYKLKFKEKQNLFGMGENKEWALMANAADPTLIKNRITSWLGEEMVFSWTPRMGPVDVVMIGSEGGRDYLGSYCLSELVDIGDSRLEIDELGENVTSTEGEENLTGGYLLSVFNLYQDADQPGSNIFALDGGFTLAHENPSFEEEDDLTEGEKAQRQYIQSYVRQVDDLIMKGDTIDETAHQQLASLMDLKSAADYWLIQEFVCNPDGFRTSSTYLHKPRNGKLAFGPLWDFDLAWGLSGSDMWYDISTAGFNNTESKWVDALRAKDPLFVKILKEEWTHLRPCLEELICSDGIIDQYGAEVSRSQQADLERWPKTGGTIDYAVHLSNLKKWIDLRMAWFDGHLDEISQSLVTISFEAEGEFTGKMNVRKEAYLSAGPDGPHKEGYVFTGWFEKDTHKSIKGYQAVQDTVFVADYLEEAKAIPPEALYFSDMDVWVLLGDSFNPDIQSCVLPENASNQLIRWTSSDTDIITVDRDGTVWGMAVGEAVLTGTLYNGVSNSLTVHVYDRSVVSEMPNGVNPVPGEIELTPGQTRQILAVLTPEDRLLKNMFLSVTSEDPSIAEVSYGAGNGKVFLVTGLKEGKTKLTIKAERDGTEYSAVCDITVSPAGCSHALVRTEAKSASCMTDGNIEYWTCTKCGKRFGDGDGSRELTEEEIRIASLGHDWGEWVVITPAVGIEEGVETRTCKRDGSHVETRKIPKSAGPADDDPGLGEDGTAFGKGADAAVLDAAVNALTSDTDPAGTAFAPLCLRAKNVTKTSVKITWKTAPGAAKYVVYANACGKNKSLQKVAETTSRSFTLKKLNGNKLKKGTYYRFMVAALDSNDRVVTVSKMIYAATNGGKAGNVGKVTTKKKTRTAKIKKGKTYKIGAKQEAADRTRKVKKYRGIRYETSDRNVAAVTSKGVIRAKNKGTCYVYAYAQNGVYVRIRVKVS